MTVVFNIHAVQYIVLTSIEYFTHLRSYFIVKQRKYLCGSEKVKLTFSNQIHPNTNVLDILKSVSTKTVILFIKQYLSIFFMPTSSVFSVFFIQFH